MAVVNHVQLSEAVTNNRFSAEFFDPRYVFTPSPHGKWMPIGRLLTKCEYGLSICMNSEGRGFPIFRMNEIKDCFALRPEKFAHIPQALFNAYALNESDVLFNRTNSFEFVGRTGLVKDQTDCTFASYLIRLVPDPQKLLPEYLTIYLNTPFGIGQVKRRAMRSINQANVSGSEVRKILIPCPDLPIQQEVAELVNAAFSEQRASGAEYQKAESLLQFELGLKELVFDVPLGYQASFSDLEDSRRTDAQHYQPRYKQLLNHLSRFRSAKVRTVRIRNRRGLQPVYIPDGQVDVINSQHLGAKHIDYEGLQKTSHSAFGSAPEAHVQNGDLLIYTTGAYIGRTNAYLSDAPAMASNHVNILRLSAEIDPAYMALVFQSVIGQLQTQQHARGSAQAELYPSDIDRFVVPLLDPEKQKEIGDLVRASLQKQQESRRLLEAAKNRVEELIEEAARG